jgi:type I restriction-modification system DNA methylase subunit
MKKPSAQDFAVIHRHIGPRHADSFRADLHPDLKADFVPVRKDLANPPFNMSDWGGENLRQDVRWKFGMPPVNNANYACRSLRNWALGLRTSRCVSPVCVAGFVMAKTTRIAHSCTMKITEAVRKSAAKQGIAEEEALKNGMEAKAKEFAEKGAEVYAKV